MKKITVRDMQPDDEEFVGTCGHVGETKERTASCWRRIPWLREQHRYGLRVKVALIDGRHVGFLYVMPVEITPWGPVGLAICYDMRFPELLRTLALAGAVLILVPAQWPTPRIEAWLILARARAIENELFIAACNRVGDDGETDFSGHSCVVNPWGHALVEGDDQERLLIAQVDLREVRKARRYLTVYEDRRPDAYHVKLAGDEQ